MIFNFILCKLNYYCLIQKLTLYLKRDFHKIPQTQSEMLDAISNAFYAGSRKYELMPIQSNYKQKDRVRKFF